MSNAIIRQEGPGSVVADNLWDIRLGAVPLALPSHLRTPLKASGKRRVSGTSLSS